MSYDLQIKIQTRVHDYVKLEHYINSLPNTRNLRFKLADSYYMEIDLEFQATDDESENAKLSGFVNLISFHIPYQFMDMHSINHDVYYDYVKQVSEFLGEKAIDLQLDLFLDDPEFEKRKRRELTGNIDANYDLFERQGNQLLLKSSKEEKKSLVVDLKECTIRFEEFPFEEKVINREFKLLKTIQSVDGNLRAITHWKEKKIKIFSRQNKNLAIELPEEELWKCEAESEIEKCGQVNSMEFSSDNKHFISNAYRTNTLKFWEVSTGKLIQNFTSYAKFIRGYLQLNEKLICINSAAGISFFDISNGKIIVHISPLRDNWLVFTPSGAFEYKTEINGAIELDWIDNDKNESYCFIPSLGFAYYERRGSFKLNKLKEKKGIYTQDLLRKSLHDYLD